MSKNKLSILYVFICELAAIVIIALYYFFGEEYKEGQQAVPEDYIESADDSIMSVSSGNVSSGNVEYEPPEYEFELDEVTVEIEGLNEEYTIAFVNDLHMITDKEAGDVLEENLSKVTERYNNLSITPEGMPAEELWPEIIKFLNYNDFDAVIFGGDILDYCSHSNMEALMKGFENLKYPGEKIIYLRSDHDYGGWYGGGVFTDTDGFIAQSELWDGDHGMDCIEFDEFLIVGVNKSYQNLSKDRLDFLTEKLDEGKPVIVVTHVPFYSEEDKSLEELSMRVRNRIYYWSKENSSYCPDKNTQTFIDKMYGTDSNVVQILAAHMHASWDGIAANSVKEHIFAPSFEGKIGIVHVTGINDMPVDIGELFYREEK